MKSPPGAAAAANGTRRYRLLRHFTLATLAAFVMVGAALFVLQRMQETFFDEVQREQAAFFARAQAELARRNEQAARASLLAVHEANHVTLTRLMANMLWRADIAPLVQAAQGIDVERCRRLPAEDGPAAQPTGRRACLADVGMQIMALPAFRSLDAKAYASMAASTVFKIKVFDLRGITVYSSEHRQIGEDGSGNRGWQTAVGGHPASELTHRDRFSAFERVVEKRDLISSYVPVRTNGSAEVVGVFEIYSDVTPFLGQIKATSQNFAEITAADQASLERAARSNQDQVASSSHRFLAIVGGLLVLLYTVSLLIVRYGQRVIDAQWRAQERSRQREQQWHREKMAALATMAASVAHEVGNPLAVISGLADDLGAREAGGESAAGIARPIRQQAERIAQMMRQISDFASPRSLSPEWVDVNAMVKAVCDFMAFDPRFRDTPIEFQPGDALPARLLVPDHLHQVLMGVLQACIEGATEPGHCGRVRVSTAMRDGELCVRVGCDPGSACAPGVARRVFQRDDVDPLGLRVTEMGGRWSATPTAVEIGLPATP